MRNLSILTAAIFSTGLISPVLQAEENELNNIYKVKIPQVTVLCDACSEVDAEERIKDVVAREWKDGKYETIKVGNFTATDFVPEIVEVQVGPIGKTPGSKDRYFATPSVTYSFASPDFKIEIEAAKAYGNAGYASRAMTNLGKLREGVNQQKIADIRNPAREGLISATKEAADCARNSFFLDKTRKVAAQYKGQWRIADAVYPKAELVVNYEYRGEACWSKFLKKVSGLRGLSVATLDDRFIVHPSSEPIDNSKTKSWGVPYRWEDNPKWMRGQIEKAVGEELFDHQASLDKMIYAYWISAIVVDVVIVSPVGEIQINLAAGGHFARNSKGTLVVGSKPLRELESKFSDLEVGIAREACWQTGDWPEIGEIGRPGGFEGCSIEVSYTDLEQRVMETSKLVADGGVVPLSVMTDFIPFRGIYGARTGLWVADEWFDAVLLDDGGLTYSLQDYNAMMVPIASKMPR